jgi:hypothetical protein
MIDVLSLEKFMDDGNELVMRFKDWFAPSFALFWESIDGIDDCCYHVLSCGALDFRWEFAALESVIDGISIVTIHLP